MVNKKTIATLSRSEHAFALSITIGTPERRMDAFLLFAFALLCVFQGNSAFSARSFEFCLRINRDPATISENILVFPYWAHFLRFDTNGEADNAKFHS